MSEITLTTVDDLKEVTSISNSIQGSILEPYIVMAEGFYVYPVIGDSLLSELQSQITGNTLTPLNQTLITTYIRPLAAYGAWFEYMSLSASKSTPAGEVLQSSSNSEPASLEIISFKRQSIKDKMKFFESKLKNYLKVNQDQYPLYRQFCQPTSSFNAIIYLRRNRN